MIAAHLASRDASRRKKLPSAPPADDFDDSFDSEEDESPEEELSETPDADDAPARPTPAAPRPRGGGMIAAHLAAHHAALRKKVGVHINPANRGKLHEALHVAKGKKIPLAKEEAAAHSDNETLRKRAQFAINARKWHHGD